MPWKIWFGRKVRNRQSGRKEMEVGDPRLGPLRCQELLSSGKSLTRLEEKHAGLILSSECFRLDPESGLTLIRGAGEQRAE